MIAQPVFRFEGVGLAPPGSRGGGAMRRIIGILTILALALVAGARAEAQTGERIFDTLGDLLRGGQRVQGYVVAIHNSDLVMRGRDDRTYTVSTTDVDRQVLTRLHPGKPLTISLKRGTGDTLMALAIEPESGQQRSYRTAAGVVDTAAGDKIQFRTNEGFVIP